LHPWLFIAPSPRLVTKRIGGLPIMLITLMWLMPSRAVEEVGINLMAVSNIRQYNIK
jgi:hypothetical protein